MSPFETDYIENGERVAFAEDAVWYIGPADRVVATERGLDVEHYCAHCGLKGGH